MHKLVLIRHGETTYNAKGLFTGWTDVNLTPRGVRECVHSGNLLKKNGFRFDAAYCSMLKRAIRTLSIVKKQIGQPTLPTEYSWRLNERHYGALQGMNKQEFAEKYGEEQVLAWRRAYDVRPPALKPGDRRNPRFDPKYKHLKKSEIPLTESLSDTVSRVLPYWNKTIAPAIRSGNRVVIAASGNSLRALVKHLDHLTKDEVKELTIPYGFPLVYELDDRLRPKRHYYLGDKKAVQRTIDRIKAQGIIKVKKK
jgi:2,3-bisphosphoglycerate-dependent phosphoglycerate mutase